MAFGEHNPEMAAGIAKYRAERAKDPRSAWSKEQIQADNRRKRLAQDAKDQGSRQAAAMASKAKRGF